MYTGNDRFSGNDRYSGLQGADHFFHYIRRLLYSVILHDVTVELIEAIT